MHPEIAVWSANSSSGAPIDSIIALVQALVRIPSRAVEDDLAPVAQRIEQWFGAHGIRHRVLRADSGAPMGLYAEVQGTRGPGRWTVLDATLDTAGFGALDSWRHAPTSAAIEDGWLHGRGSGDSKAGVALFAHLLQEFAAAPQNIAGRIGVLFDCDEHSGRFGGARAFFDRPFREGEAPPRPDGVVIGYPGMDAIVNGCRGFVRARLLAHGVAAHSGATHERGVNAALRAADLCRALHALPLPTASAAFPLSPQLTITGIRGGAEGFSQVPDTCELRIDVRLTPGFDDAAARGVVADAVRRFDASRGTARTTEIEWIAGWPAYQVTPSHPLAAAMQQAAQRELGIDVPMRVVGPSNIGNYLASLGVPALCGFGVVAEGVHAANERIALESLAPVYRIYRSALQHLHGA
jgi:succinyl-diaminopimelate desuccinylase